MSSSTRKESSWSPRWSPGRLGLRSEALLSEGAHPAGRRRASKTRGRESAQGSTPSPSATWSRSPGRSRRRPGTPAIAHAVRVRFSAAPPSRKTRPGRSRRAPAERVALTGAGSIPGSSATWPRALDAQLRLLSDACQVRSLGGALSLLFGGRELFVWSALGFPTRKAQDQPRSCGSPGLGGHSSRVWLASTAASATLLLRHRRQPRRVDRRRAARVRSAPCGNQRDTLVRILKKAAAPKG